MSESLSSSGSGPSMDFDLTQFYQVFFEEAGENLANMESLLLDLDVSDPDDEDLNAIFRCAHSIKGGAATFGFQDVADLTHVMETLLDRLRRHELQVQAPMVDVLLESGDALRSLLARHQGSSDAVMDASDLVARIRAHVSGDVVPAAVKPSLETAAPEAPVAAPVAPATPQSTPAAAVSVAEGERCLSIRLGPGVDESVVASLGDLFREIPGLGSLEPLDAGHVDAAGLRHLRIVTRSPDEELLDLFSFHVSRDAVRIEAQAMAAPVAAAVAPPAVDAGVPAPATSTIPGPSASASPASSASASPASSASADEGFGFFVDIEAEKQKIRAAREEGVGQEASALDPAQAASAPVATAGARATRSEKPAATMDAQTLRVSIEKVDQLINIVGELVITQAMLAQTGRNLDPIANQQMMGNLVDLERNTRLLQEAVMAIRMIPMAVVFSRFPRMLRDLAGRLGKQIDLHTIGEATELDKGMVEKITDPLTHLVRNAVDHGIELPEERIAKGKPAVGSITLSAEHKGGSIAIEVRDDGRGLNRERIYRKAQERGLAVHEQMSDQDVFQLIFEPGFSTADEVTDVSGRGVGMDVVRRNILSLGGSVEIDSAEGWGMRVTVRLPLTLAIMDGMSVAVGDEIYILPLASVVESIRIDSTQMRSVAGTGRVLEVRNEYLPVVALDEIFSVPRFESAERDPIVIIIEAEGQRIALMVDELVGQHQVVVKNLEANYRKVSGVSGATILGDGRVALILDVAHLVRRTRH